MSASTPSVSIAAAVAQARQLAPTYDVAAMASRGIGWLDLTTLESTDTEASVHQLVHRATAAHVAAVCIYPRFCASTAPLLAGSSVALATVAMAFPHGQGTLDVRVREVERAAADGADEIDIVIQRGDVLADDWSGIGRDVRAAVAAASGRHIKVILETSELACADRIARATREAVDAGAHFVKTSTGKSPMGGATPEAAAAMLFALRASGARVGIKIAGGVRTLEDFLLYVALTETILGAEALTPDRFRVGASSLLGALQAAAFGAQNERC